MPRHPSKAAKLYPSGSNRVNPMTSGRYAAGMNRQIQKNKSSNKPTSAVAKGGGGSAMGDKQSSGLRVLGQAIGNKQLTQLLETPGGRRDVLLNFVVQRLQVIREVQIVELQEGGDQKDWFRDVFRGKEGHHMPDPGRWVAAAEDYKKAGEALCMGDMGRAMQFLEDAIQLERDAFENMPLNAQQELDSWHQSPIERDRPVEADGLRYGDRCESRTKPNELKIADLIIQLQPEVTQVTVRGNRPHNWFEEAEDELPEDGGAGV